MPITFSALTKVLFICSSPFSLWAEIKLLSLLYLKSIIQLLIHALPNKIFSSCIDQVKQVFINFGDVSIDENTLDGKAY